MILAVLPLFQGGANWPPVTADVTHVRPISAYIYGANFPDWNKKPAPFTIVRLGGNRMTAYNWENNASNAGNDYHNQNDGYMGDTNEPGYQGSTFITAAQKHHAVALITIPTAGHVAADKAPEGDVNQTPDYLNKRFEVSLPTKPGGQFAYPPDLTDNKVYQDEAVHYYESVAQKSKVPVWYILDNEPDLWQSTHARIVPQNVGYAGIVANNIEYAKAIKAVAPKTLVFGLASYGWNGYTTFQNAPDANGRDFLDFYLQSMAAAGKAANMRLIDVLDLHWYPEATGGGKRITDGEGPETREARVQAPRSLWDPTYVEKSWITQSIGNKPIRLIPWVNQKIAKNYPGTRLAFNEYNYGGANDPSGLVAQADVLGIFGRYGVFTACNWGIDTTHKAEQAAFNAFLNYDGKGSRFGAREIGVTGEQPAQNSFYVSMDPNVPGRTVMVIINKTNSEKGWTISIPGAGPWAPLGFLADYTDPTKHTPMTVDKSASTFSGKIPGYGVETVVIEPDHEMDGTADQG